MKSEFHYEERDWNELKRRLPDKWISADHFLSESLPSNKPYGLPVRADFYRGIGPDCIFVWVSKDRKKVISNKVDDGEVKVDCREWFLEILRPELQYARSHNSSKAYIPAGEREDILNRCNKKFKNLLNFVLELPEHVRRELGEGIYELGTHNLEAIEKLEAQKNELNEAELAELDTRRGTAQGRSLDLEDLEAVLINLVDASEMKLGSIDKKAEVFGHNFYRAIFINTMLRKYLKIYGDLPIHTFKRPDNTPGRRFIGAAKKFCRIAGFSDGNLQCELGAAKQAISTQITS